MASETARSCPVERIYEELGRREYKERSESAECFVEERLMRWADERYAELKVRREVTCYYDNDGEEEPDEEVEEYVVGIDGRVAFTSINLDPELTDEVVLDAERAERIRSLILRAKTWSDFHKIWDIVSEYIIDAELEASPA